MPRAVSHIATELTTLHAFRDELRKEAGPLTGLLSNPRVHSALGGAGALGGIGAAGGALIGGGIEGVRGFQAARREGAGVGQAAMAGAGTAFSGASKGALIGGGVGLAGGALLGGARPGRMEDIRQALTTAGGGVGMAARYGQRQVHGLTGWRPGEEVSSIREIGAGAQSAREHLQNVRKNVPKVLAKDPSNTGVIRDLRQAREGYGASVRAEEMGLTSIPGYVRSMRDNGVVPTLSAGFKEQWHNQGGTMKALMVGVPLADAAHAAFSPDQEGQPGKAERVAGRLTNAVSGMTMGAMPLTTGALVGAGLGHVGGAIGRGIDHLRRGPKAPTGHVVSAGMSPESITSSYPGMNGGAA